MSDTLLYIILGVIVLDLAVVAYYYFRVFRPTRAVEMGMDLLRAQDFSSRLAPVGFRQADNLVAMFNEMLDRLKTERLRLEEQNYFLEQLIRVSPMGVILCDYDGNFISANGSALRFLEVSDQLLGKKIEEIKTPLAEKISRLKIGDVETVRMSDAKIFRVQKLSFIDRGFARPFILIESLTEEVMEAEKRAYEKVIRMIAHEVNNTVAGVGSILQSLGEEDEAMQVCNTRLQNLSQFITRFADVVKIPEPNLRAYNINKVIENSANFLQSLCSQRGISFEVNYAENPKTILLDAPLFEQVLVNIVKNAVESIGEKMLSVQKEECTKADVTTQKDEPYLGKIVIKISEDSLEVIDNGMGISEEVASRLFTPFFSSKPSGQGIGLLFVKEVLRKHGFSFSLFTDAPTPLTHFRIVF